MSTISRVTIPMDDNLRQQLKQKAADLGFDSSQALLRYVSKAIIDGRQISFGQDDWGQPSPKAAARLNKAADEALRGINVSKPFYSAEEALAHLKSL